MSGLLKKLHKSIAVFTDKLTEVVGTPLVFFAVFLLISLWFVLGIFFRYNQSWFTILDVFIFLTTFFLVFTVQFSQNADTKAIQDKLDDIIDSLPKANKKLEAEEKKLKKGEDK